MPMLQSKQTVADIIKPDATEERISGLEILPKLRIIPIDKAKIIITIPGLGLNCFQLKLFELAGSLKDFAMGKAIPKK